MVQNFKVFTHGSVQTFLFLKIPDALEYEKIEK